MVVHVTQTVDIARSDFEERGTDLARKMKLSEQRQFDDVAGVRKECRRANEKLEQVFDRLAELGQGGGQGGTDRHGQPHSPGTRFSP